MWRVYAELSGTVSLRRRLMRDWMLLREILFSVKVCTCLDDSVYDMIYMLCYDIQIKV